MAISLKDIKEEKANDWCPGCGDFGVLNAVQMALVDLQWEPHSVAIFSGIGCSGKTSHYIRTYGVHTLHGRVLAFATGAKLAKPDLKVVAVGGDGDGYGIGACHFVNAGRRNLDMAYVVFNNEVYGLTKGQASPTLREGEKTKSLPLPNVNANVNPLATALASGYTWVGRGYSFDIKHLKGLIKAAIDHKGAALLDVLQPCPTYNDLHDKEWYSEPKVQATGMPRIYKLDAEPGWDPVVHDPTDRDEIARKQGQAIAKTMEWGERIPIGVFYRIEKPTYEERLAHRMPGYPQKNPSNEKYWDDAGRPTTSITHILDGMKVL